MVLIGTVELKVVENYRWVNIFRDSVGFSSILLAVTDLQHNHAKYLIETNGHYMNTNVISYLIGPVTTHSWGLFVVGLKLS